MDKDLQKPIKERPEKKEFGLGQDKRLMTETGRGVVVGDTGEKTADGLMSSSSSLQPSQITAGTKHHQPLFTQLAGIRTDDPVGVYNPELEEKMKSKPYLIR